MNLSFDILIGNVYENNAGQKYKVLGISGTNVSGNKKYCIEFLETGYSRDVEKVEIKRGKIKDKLARSVFGIGILGEVNMVDHKRAYSVWSSMLERCYEPSSFAYPSYGGKGVKVAERWLCFKNFLEDLECIEGYQQEKFDSGEIYLDKDKKQFNLSPGDKVYSLETCCFLSFEENNALRNNEHRKRTFIALSPSGEEIHVKGLKEFAREQGLIRQAITNCIKGRSRSHKGWRFFRNENVEGDIV
jgi:hypothetical protein